MNDERIALRELKDIDREIVRYEHIAALLGWDQETCMPRGAVAGRAEQLSMLMSLIHRKMTADKVGQLLKTMGASEALPGGSTDLADIDRGLIRRYFRAYQRGRKLPQRLVEEFASVTSTAQAIWAEARRKRDFPAFLPHLEKVVTLTREAAEHYGYTDHPYDPLLEEYEPGMTTRETARVFAVLKERIVPLLARIAEADTIDDSFLYLEYDTSLQDRFGRKVLEDMGFDFSRGSLTESAHPFTTAVGIDDIRITTRYHEPAMTSALFSTIHEGGHALYELGAASPELKGTILGTGTSLAVHESQSRFWENVIGRSREFWARYYPLLKDYFPDQLSGIDLEAFVRGINKVAPSMIRVNADEVTYSLHVILRFELETALMTRDLEPAGLPAAWNDGMRNMLGIVPQHDGEGVLQDVHWSAGLIGYFPTYALGNLFGAQFTEAMKADMPDYARAAADGRLGDIHGWLGRHIYSKGAIYTAGEILDQVTGKPLDPTLFTDYLYEKYSRIYGLT